jgi:hypothetical protein
MKNASSLLRLQADTIKLVGSGRIPAQARGRAIRYYENAMRFHTAPIPCAALLFKLSRFWEIPAFQLP